MFYAPTFRADLEPVASIELYSDRHKEAFRCRPGAAQMAREKAMTPAERAVEEATIDAFMEESERIAEMRREIALFDFSRRMEYLQRRGDASSRKEALRLMVEEDCRYFFKVDSDRELDWDRACYSLNLPYSYAPKLQAIWEE